MLFTPSKVIPVNDGVLGVGRWQSLLWVEAEKRYPASLPYWSHKRGIVAEDGLYIPDSKSSLPDAISGAHLMVVLN